MQGVLQQVPVPRRRDWGKRLQLRLLQGQDPGQRQNLHSHGRRRGHRCHRGQVTESRSPLFTVSRSAFRTKQFGPLLCSRQQRLIKAGATHLVVPGNLPIGCSSAYLTLHPGRNSSDYDAAGCLKTYNDFAQHHNAVLQQNLRALRVKYPQARIMYADYYGAAMSFAKNPKQFGECNCSTTSYRDPGSGRAFPIRHQMCSSHN